MLIYFFTYWIFLQKYSTAVVQNSLSLTSKLPVLARVLKTFTLEFAPVRQADFSLLTKVLKPKHFGIREKIRSYYVEG